MLMKRIIVTMMIRRMKMRTDDGLDEDEDGGNGTLLHYFTLLSFSYLTNKYCYLQ